MPPWGDKLDEAEVRAVSAYVHQLGGGEASETRHGMRRRGRRHPVRTFCRRCTGARAGPRRAPEALLIDPHQGTAQWPCDESRANRSRTCPPPSHQRSMPRASRSFRAASPARSGTLKWWVMGVTLGIYYLTPWMRWDRGPELPEPGGAGGPGEPPLLLLLDRDLVARILLRRRFADHGRAGPFPLHLRAGPRLVRLYLPADRLDRPLHPGRALDRGRPERPHPAAQGAVGRAQMAPEGDEMGGLAADRHGDGRRLGVLFHRCADPGRRIWRPSRPRPSPI